MESSEKANSNEQQQLAWSQEIPNYGNKLLKRLDEFRKTTILYDVRVLAEGGEFNAHKVILAACGGIFRTCFIDEKRKMIASDITELNLDCPSQGLKPIIRFAYTGALVVTKRNAVATMIAAEVTRMKEVQEICADIAVKEYGWIIQFTGEKDAVTLDNLDKVLQIHASCFVNSTASSEDELKEMPFATEVRKEFPEKIGVYQKLSLKLKVAEGLLESSKTNGEAAPKHDKSDSGTNGLISPTATNIVPKDPFMPKQVIAEESKPKGEIPHASNSKKKPPIPKGSPPKPQSAVGVEKKTSLSETPPSSEDKLQTTSDESKGKKKPRSTTPPVPESVVTSDSEKKSLAPNKVYQDSESASVANGKKIPAVNPSPAKKKPSKPENIATAGPVPKIEVPSSPTVKPRASVRSKKAAPPPPSPNPAQRAPKTPANPPPPRPQKQPAKVPPPRPKPPAKKKSSSDQQQDTPTKKNEGDDYDDNLNPFA